MIAGIVAMVAVVGALLTLAIYAINATKRAGSQQARGDTLAVRLEVAIANAHNEGRRADAEKERADALDAAIVEAASIGPVAGSYERLQQARRDAVGSARRGDAAVVRDAGDRGREAEALGPDDLLKPGEE